MSESLTNLNRAVRFYFIPDDGIYSSSYKSKFKLKGDVNPVFNPVIKTVDTLTALTCQNKIELEGEDESLLSLILGIWKANAIQIMKFDILRDLILRRRAVVEIYRRVDGSIGIMQHNPEQVKIKKNDGNIRYAEIKGFKTIFNPDKQDYEEKEVLKKFYDEEGFRYVIEECGNEKTQTPLAYPFIPVVEFSSDYNITNMVEISDDINQKRAWLKNISEMHGNPILEIAGEVAGSENIKHNNGFKGMQVPEQNTLKYIEMQGNIAELMLKEINDLEKTLSNDYPEYALGNLLAGSNIGENTSMIKFSEISAKINSLRADLSEGLHEINKKVLVLSGKKESDIEYVYGDIFKADKKRENTEIEFTRVQVIEKYKNIGSHDLLNRALIRLDLEEVSLDEWGFMESVI